MANNNHLRSVTLYNVTMNRNNYYNDFFELGQQKINFNFYELSLPDDDPVFTIKKVMEEMDFTALLAQYSGKGKHGFNPIMKYGVLTYANMRGIREIDRIVELCKRDLAFIWLSQGQQPKRDAFYDFINKKLTPEILDDLNYQLLRRLKKEGIDKVRAVIEKNRKRKLTKHKKLPNNTIIEIDNCSPLDLLKLQKNLMMIAENEGIQFVYGKGKKKSEIQQLYEELGACGTKLMEYKECFEVMGKERNSYSKTDLEATFMRMKDDHMMNGQLKAAYNVQIAVENYFIVHVYVSNDRTDYNTLIPVVQKHLHTFGDVLKEVTADSGYCSEKNLLFLKEHSIESYIKLQDHEQRKTRAYKENIGKYYNMTTQIFEDEHFYVCHDGRELRHIRTEEKEMDGYTQTLEVYGCADCSGCEHKARCLYKYNPEKDTDKNKVMKINERWEALKERSHANIQSEKGILNRQIRSIQTEGHFGDIKENDDFRRFNHRTTERVYKEFMLYAIGRNINKYHRFLCNAIQKFEGKKGENVA